MILSDLSDPRAYDELLSLLRRDLQLDLATDVVAGSQASLLHLGIARGVSSIAFAGSANSAGTTVSHGLGSTPTAVVAVSFNAPTFATLPTLNVFSVTATTFQVDGFVAAPYTGSLSFFWVALI